MSSTLAKQVEIYGIFCKLNRVNTIHGNFEGEIDIVTSWLDNIQGNYDPERHWNPQLVYKNVMDKEMKIRTRVEIKPQNDQENQSVRIVQYQKLNGTFSEWLHVQQFPFDVQKIGVLVTSLHPMSRITLIGKVEYCYLAQRAIHENDSWDFNQNVSIDYSTYQEHTPYLRSQQYPLIKFNVFIARKGQFYITNLILPLFMVTSTILVSFTHDLHSINSRLQSCATTLLTSINFRFVIHKYIPNVPYSTYLDMYSMASIAFITLVFGWHAYTKKQIEQVTYAQLDDYVTGVFVGIFIIGHILFIIFAWILPKRRQKNFLKNKHQTNNQSEENQPIELENLLGYEHSVEKLAID